MKIQHITPAGNRPLLARLSQQVILLWPGREHNEAAAHRHSSVGSLHALAERIQDVSRRTEPDFVALAKRLDAVHSSALQIGTAVGASAASIRNLLGDQTLYGAEGVAVRVARQSSKQLRQTTEDKASLSVVNSGLAAIRKHTTAIEDVTRALGVAVPCLAMESVRSAGARQAFGTYVEELRTVVGRLQALASDIAAHAETNHTALARVLRSMDEDLSRMRSVAGASQHAAEEAQRKVREFLEDSLAALSQTDVHASSLTRAAEQAVFHLQFGDIIRQKLEHVTAALRECAATLPGSGEADSDRSPGVVAGELLRVQTGQLESTESELNEAAGRLAAAFTDASRTTRQLIEVARHRLAGAGNEAAEASVFEALAGNLTRVSKLREQGLALRDRARKACESSIAASGRVSDLIDQVEQINHEMHLQSLNAIVATERLGAEGGTIEVLSMYLHQHSQELNRIVIAIAEELGRIDSATRSIEASSGQTPTEECATASAIETLNRLQTTFLDGRTEVRRLIDIQTSELAAAEAGFQFLRRLGAEITSVREAVAGMARLSRPRDDRTPERDAPSELAERYTMESEREVHRAISAAGGGAVSGAPAPTARAEAEAAHNFGENVDLF